MRCKIAMNDRPGSDLLVAGYCMYGSSVEMVITGTEGLYGEGVHRFALDPSMGALTGPT